MKWRRRDPNRWRWRFLFLPRRFETEERRWLEWYAWRPARLPLCPFPGVTNECYATEYALSGDVIMIKAVYVGYVISWSAWFTAARWAQLHEERRRMWETHRATMR